jgi:hypothetical protein
MQTLTALHVMGNKTFLAALAVIVRHALRG